MTIFIQAKKLGKTSRVVAPCPYKLPQCPDTLRELIRMLVLDSIRAYQQRLANTAPTVLSQEELDALGQVGKIAFGIHEVKKDADPQKALDAAFEGFQDGLYRFFINDTEISDLDAPLQLQEHDSLTIIRLVMLTGGFF